MTQYSDKVEEVRLKQEAESWGKGIKYLHVNDGIIEKAYLIKQAVIQPYPIKLEAIYMQNSERISDS